MTRRNTKTSNEIIKRKSKKKKNCGVAEIQIFVILIENKLLQLV